MKNRVAAQAVFLIAALVASFAPASAKNDINFAFQQNPSSAQLNGLQRNEDLGVGTFWYDFFGTVPKFANLSVTPSSGLYVQVAPAITNTLGAVYVPMADDTSVFGTGAVALPADPTIITRQGLLSSPPISLGVPAPSGSGTSIAYLAECTVARGDANPFQYNFINNANQVTQGTIYHDRLDTVTCLAKASTPASIPTLPAPDANYVGVAGIVVPNGANATTTGMITMQPSNVIGNSLQAYNGASVNQQGCFIPGGGTVTALCSASLIVNGPATVNATLTVGGGLSVASAVNASGSIYSSAGVSTAGSFTVGSVALGQGGLSVPSNGSVNVGSGTLTGTSFSVPGTVSGTSGFFNATNSLTLGTASGNATINVPGNGSLYTNYYSGAGGILFCNGAQACPASISAAGNVNGVQGNFSSGLTASTGTFSSNVTGTNFIASAGYIAGNGIFNSTAANATICLNNGATCPFLEDAYGTHFSAAGSTVTLGAYGQDENAGGGLLNIGTSATGSTTIGASYSSSIRGINGGVLRIGECTSSHSACDVSSQTDFTIDTNGNIAALNNVVGAVFATSSLRSLKRNIHPVTDDPLAVVGTVSPQWWNYKTDKRNELPRLGIVADDTNADISGPKKDHLDVGALAVMDAAATNKLHTIVTRQQNEIRALENDVRRLSARTR